MFRQLLARLAASLDRAAIPYMVIGGQAVLLYGEPRLTRDVDLTLGVGPEALPQILRLLAEAGWRPLPADPAEFVARTLVLPALDPASGIRLDFVFSISPYERRAVARGRPVAIAGVPVKFASPEDVIIHKMIAARSRQPG